MKHSSPNPDPRQEYTQRLSERRAVSAKYQRLHITLGNWRLAAGAAAAFLGWLAFFRGAISGWWLLAPAAALVALLVIHERILRGARRAERSVLFFEQGLGRIEDRWAGMGETGKRFADPSHPYAEDLDIFGKGSLFELLSTARTRAGENILARWLLAPSPLDDIRARHAGVDELRSRLDLREDLALLGEEVRTGVRAEALANWGEAPAAPVTSADRVLAAVLPALLAASIAVFALQGIAAPFFAIGLAQAAFAWRHRDRVLRIIEAAERPAEDLALLSEVLVRIERESFSSPRLSALRAALDTGGHPPSREISRLHRLAELLDSRDHVAIRVAGPLLLWTTQLAFAVEAWRKRSGPAVRQWLDALGEIEAISALAGYAYEHPADPFPEFTSDSPCLEGEALGHPLLPESRMVRNDVRFDRSLSALIVSGSNMSGKSTYLRTIGTNAVLAMAGAPVRARRLRLSALTVGASIRTMDSLQGGTSRFYAEILRLRQIIDLAAGPRPVLFLLDELLHGTNSHDRRIGAQAVVLGLVQRGAVGLVTTHDLALADITAALGDRARNVHFEDHLENGKMIFDYKLREGVVSKSNALELMRSVGLEV